MSIVERALQKARKDARGAHAGADHGETTETIASPASAPPSHSASPEPRETPAGGSSNPAIGLQEDGPVVQLDVERLRAEGRLPSLDLARQTDDEIRRIKWPLLRNIEDGNGEHAARNNAVLVTSAMPGEGKTFVSLNLALSIVRDRERQVILVDGDVARPGLTPSLGLEHVKGLNDVLEDTSLDVSSVTYRTNVEGFYFLPAGKFHELAPELLAGSRMERLFSELTKAVGNGVVIVDSPPLLATNEAQVATRYVGQVLLVVRADTTEQRAVKDAVGLVDKSTPVMAVLNRVDATALSRYYGHYYYKQGYGRAYERPSEPGKGNA